MILSPSTPLFDGVATSLAERGIDTWVLGLVALVLILAGAATRLFVTVHRMRAVA